MSGVKIEGKYGGSVEFGVMSVPNRKSKVLYRSQGVIVDVLAYFRSDDDADAFQRIIDFLLSNAGSYMKREDR